MTDIHVGCAVERGGEGSAVFGFQKGKGVRRGEFFPFDLTFLKFNLYILFDHINFLASSHVTIINNVSDMSAYLTMLTYIQVFIKL